MTKEIRKKIDCRIEFKRIGEQGGSSAERGRRNLKNSRALWSSKKGEESFPSQAGVSMAQRGNFQNRV